MRGITVEVSLKTKIGGLLDTYPFLLDFLTEQSPQFNQLKSPILRKTLAKVTSISQAAFLGGLAPDELLLGIVGQIYLHSNDSVVVVNPGGRERGELRLTREERIKAFKDIVTRIHQGESLDAVRSEFHDILKDVSPVEVGAMEQALVADGIDEAEIKKLCNLHVELFDSSLSSGIPEMMPGHPLHTLQAENREAESRAAHLHNAAERMSDDLTFSAARSGVILAVEDLSALIRHYERKENQLFPLMESYGLTAPPQVMWAIHDDIRGLFKQVLGALNDGDRDVSVSLITELTIAIRDLVYKEEQILFPMAYETFSEEDWARVRRGEEEIGFAWVTPGDEWKAEEYDTGTPPQGGEDLVYLSAGKLRPEVVDAILQSLPIDLSFVDAQDRVAYFSQTEHRIFPRSEGILGREVSRCHPSQSVYMVEKILEKFRSGERDMAEFWIEMKGSFIHIRFYAIRQRDGEYAGCLEVAQDVTHIRGLQGQQRLLDWE